MEISVIIPTWNRRDLLPRAINSVYSQTLPATQIIVVDDGSDDGTSNLITSEYPGVTLLEQQNAGVSAARNLGLRNATGEWIAFLDSDDEWLPQKLASQAALLAASPDLRACHTEEIWIRNGKRVNAMRKHAKPVGDIFAACLPLCCVSPSSVLLHQEVFDTAGQFDESLPACEDYDLWLRVFSRFQAGLVTAPVLNKYGGHPDQLSKQFWGMDRFRVVALEKLLATVELTSRQRDQTASMLETKCGILALGCDKRGRTAEAADWRARAAVVG